MKEKRSFFERLTGSISVDDFDAEEQDIETAHIKPTGAQHEKLASWMSEDPAEGQLSVDVFQTPTHIIIKSMIAGVRREDVDIAISRDMLTIKGKREEERGIQDGDYFHKELYWGTFSRTILLPHEIEIEGAEAIENMGMLTIRLPKVDKEKKAKLKVMKSQGGFVAN